MASTTDAAPAGPPERVPPGIGAERARELADALRALRVECGLTQVQLAEAARVNVASVERVEAAGHESLHPGVVHAMAAALEHRIVLVPDTAAAPRGLRDLLPSRDAHAEFVRTLDDPDLATT